MIKKEEHFGVVVEKRKAMDEDEDMESGTRKLYNIRTFKQINDFWYKPKYLVMWLEPPQVEQPMISMMPGQRRDIEESCSWL